MPIKRDKNGVTLVIFKLIWDQICEMSNVSDQRAAVEGRNVQAIRMPTDPKMVGTFWVCATMLLGPSDAMMLAAIANDNEEWGLVWFDGLEVL